MKIEKVSETDYKLYIYFNDINQLNMGEKIKIIIKKLQKKLKLKGYYKVIACSKEFGLFLQLIKIEDSLYRNTLDLRIITDNDLDIYFKTKDYFVIKTLNTIKYYDKYFYGLVDNSFDKILEKVEYGEFIFGNDVVDYLENAIAI